jgi:hypothetical protein
MIPRIVVDVGGGKVGVDVNNGWSEHDETSYDDCQGMEGVYKVLHTRDECERNYRDIWVEWWCANEAEYLIHGETRPLQTRWRGLATRGNGRWLRCVPGGVSPCVVVDVEGGRWVGDLDDWSSECDKTSYAGC